MNVCTNIQSYIHIVTLSSHLYYCPGRKQYIYHQHDLGLKMDQCYVYMLYVRTLQSVEVYLLSVRYVLNSTNYLRT